jgi:electron transfer flavoprotein alpha subunit
MEVAGQRQAVVKKPRGAGAQKKRVNPGRARLSKAADENLAVFSEDIAFMLLEKTIKGDVTSAKLLVALAEGQFDCEDEGTVRTLLSLAERLAAEPECSGVVIDAKWEDGSAQRETDLVIRSG